MNKVKLGDICTVVSGSTPKSNVEEYWNGNIKWITPAEITSDSYIIDDTERHITDEAVKKTNLTLLPVGTVLLSSRAPIGKIAIAGAEMYCNQGFKNLICSERIYNKYLYFFLNSKVDYLNKLGRGATFKEISKGIVEEVEIPLPSLDEQKNIVKHFEAIQQLINNRKQALSVLDDLVKSRFIEMFGDININDKNWLVKPLGELCSIYRGGSPRPINAFLGGDVPWIKIGDATKGDEIYLHETKEYIIHEGVKKSRMVKKGSLIFANCGVSLGFARIITFDGCIHDGWLSFEDIDESLDKVFLLLSLNQMTEHFRDIAPEGTQPNLNTAIMKGHRQIIPPIELQRQFVEFIKLADKSKFAVQQSIDTLQTLKAKLMQDYFG